MGVKDVSDRWLKASKALKKEGPDLWAETCRGGQEAVGLTTASRAAGSASTSMSADGRALVSQLCSRCHPLDRVNNAKKDRAGWTATVDGRPAEVLPADGFLAAEIYGAVAFAFALVILVLAINVLGDWLRDALNPKLR